MRKELENTVEEIEKREVKICNDIGLRFYKIVSPDIFVIEESHSHIELKYENYKERHME